MQRGAIYEDPMGCLLFKDAKGKIVYINYTGAHWVIDRQIRLNDNPFLPLKLVHANRSEKDIEFDD